MLSFVLSCLGFKIRRQSYYLFPNPPHTIVQKDTNIVELTLITFSPSYQTNGELFSITVR